MKTYQPKHKDIKRNWHLLDAKGKSLGRLSSDIAKLLIGKHKESYSAHMDMGDVVVVVNAKDVVLTGKKILQKKYLSHSMYPGGFKEVKLAKLMEENPCRVIEYAVFGMIPGNRLRDKRMKRLKIFSGSTHKFSQMFIEKNHDKK